MQKNLENLEMFQTTKCCFQGEVYVTQERLENNYLQNIKVINPFFQWEVVWKEKNA